MTDQLGALTTIFTEFLLLDNRSTDVLNSRRVLYV